MGDFNEIKGSEEKGEEWGRGKKESSFCEFRKFISDMELGDIRFRGYPFTWANNRDGECFIQERLDRFLGSAEWMLQFDTTEVTHFRK